MPRVHMCTLAHNLCRRPSHAPSSRDVEAAHGPALDWILVTVYGENGAGKHRLLPGLLHAPTDWTHASCVIHDDDVTQGVGQLAEVLEICPGNFNCMSTVGDHEVTPHIRVFLREGRQRDGGVAAHQSETAREAFVHEGCRNCRIWIDTQVEAVQLGPWVGGQQERGGMPRIEPRLADGAHPGLGCQGHVLVHLLADVCHKALTDVVGLQDPAQLLQEALRFVAEEGRLARRLVALVPLRSAGFPLLLAAPGGACDLASALQQGEG
mmetsp:Transcript_72565/g.200145  ORF Transcript_72565/g.200145 Transcript_72565/m.200145 type:complete len:266 (-) Transcript_72565:153-950(-)